jgi:AcrR family transcriptional regulator
MENKRRTQVERSAATRAALIAAARELWAARGYGDVGYGDVGTPEIAAAAGVTRGAMYHQFADKSALFAAVVDAVEADVTARLVRDLAASQPPTAAAALHRSVDVWLTASEDREVRQIVLLDGAAVLGWDALRDVALKYALGLTEELLSAAMAEGRLERRPVRPLAHVLIGAFDEAALYAATATDRDAARAEIADALHALVDGLLIPDGSE